MPPKPRLRLLRYEMKNIVYMNLVTQGKMRPNDPKIYKVQQSMEQIQEKLPFIEDRQWKLHDMVFSMDQANDEDMPYIRRFSTNHPQINKTMPNMKMKLSK